MLDSIITYGSYSTVIFSIVLCGLITFITMYAIPKFKENKELINTIQEHLKNSNKIENNLQEINKKLNYDEILKNIKDTNTMLLNCNNEIHNLNNAINGMAENIIKLENQLSLNMQLIQLATKQSTNNQLDIIKDLLTNNTIISRLGRINDDK